MYDTIIFGLDGTLLNTLEDITDSVNETLNHFDYPLRTEAEVSGYMGNGLRRLIERALPADADALSAKKAYHFFKQYYTSHAISKTHPYEGILDLLSDLNKKGMKLAVFSNKNQEAVSMLVNTFFSGMFMIYLGDSEKTRKKPDPSAIVTIKKELISENALFIGDSYSDLQTADNAKIPCILVRWGFEKHIDLLEVETVSTVKELASKLSALT